MSIIRTSKQGIRASRFLLSHWKLLLLTIVLFVGLALVTLGLFNLEGRALIAVLILGGLLISFAAIRMTINSIGKSAIEREEAKELKEKLEQSEETRKDLEQELKESYQKPLKIMSIEPILKLGVIEVNLQLTKFFDRYYYRKSWDGKLEKSLSEDKNTNMRFMGGLTAKFKARYGIDLVALKAKRDPETKKLYVSGANPSFQGTKDFPDIHWEGSIMMGYHFWNAWEIGDKYDKYEWDCKENLRDEFQKSLKSGPEELEYLIKPLQDHIRLLIQGIFAPPGYSVELVDDTTAKDFLPFLDYLGKQGVQELENRKQENTTAIKSPKLLNQSKL